MPPSERRIAIATTTAMRAYLADASGWDFKNNKPTFPDYSKLTQPKGRRR